DKLTQGEIFFDGTGESINDAGQVAGNSAAGPCVHQPDGRVDILAGVSQASAFGISTDGRVSGQECVPNGPPLFGCTLHGFTWHPLEGYKRIDLPAAVGTKIQTRPLAATKYNQVLIEYYVSTEQNATLEHGFCIWANGGCGAPFVLSFDHVGGPINYLRDFNDLGQSIIQHIALPPRLQLYDDGMFFDISGWPLDWQLTQIEGMSNDGDFVGAFRIKTDVDPRGIPIRQDFIATPRRGSHDRSVDRQ